MTDLDFRAWLKGSGAVRCVLVEAGVAVGGVETVRYLSSANYTTRPTDAPANLGYRSIIGGDLTITESMPLDGSASLTWGDIEISNEDGSRDGWLNDVWVNRPIQIFAGDVRWPRADFRLIFSGTIAAFHARARGVLNLTLSDKLQRLNTPVSDNRLGGATENKDRLRPLCFGECHNVEPLLVNPATLTFQLHDGPIERIIEVRDNGVPVAFTANLGAGTFTLGAQPAGLVTASVQGDKADGVWRYTAGALIALLTTRYGKEAGRFDPDAEIDRASFDAFEAAHPQPVGLYLPDRVNLLEACAQLAASLGAQVLMSPEGRLRVVKVQLPAVGSPSAVGPGQMEALTLQISDRPPVAASAKVAYCKNWTVQTALQSGIPEQHKNLFALEWLTVTAANALTAADYRLAVEPVQRDTLLLREAEAGAEAARLLALWGAQRTVYAFGATAELLLEPLGGAIRLSNARFGLAAGRAGQVVGVKRNWTRFRASLEVLV